MNRLFCSVATFSAAAVFRGITVDFNAKYAFADTSNANINEVKLSTSSDNTGADDDENESVSIDPEKEECPFCKHFLLSPCAVEFKKWSKCVDKCKVDESDFVKVCEKYTKKLLDCTSEHVEYFKDIDKNDDEDTSEDEEEDSSTITTGEVKENNSGSEKHLDGNSSVINAEKQQSDR